MPDLPLSKPSVWPKWNGEKLFFQLSHKTANAVLILLCAIIVSLVVGSWPTIQHFGISFLYSTAWNPVNHQFGALNAVLGTLISSAIALFLGVPISFGIAVFITEHASIKSNRLLKLCVQLMAGIPSIIYGMWALFFLAPFLGDHVAPFMNSVMGKIPLIGSFFKGPPLGIGLLTAGIILAIMIIPIISAVMTDIFESIPAALKESAVAVGATRWEYMTKILVPYARNGLLGSIILGFGRALGETMAVTFIIGNSHQLPKSLLLPTTTIASTIANEFTEATGRLYPSALLELGLILFIITFTVLVIARLMLKPYQPE